MIVLGLDQSMRCGWALGKPGTRPLFGTYHLPDYGGHEGRTFWAMVDWLNVLMIEAQVSVCFWEQVWIPPQARLDTNKLFKLVSIANAIQAACARINVEDRYVTAGEWRQAFLGSAKGGRDFLKQQAINECKARDWNVNNDHEAEACGIWAYGCELETGQACARDMNGRLECI